MRRVTRLPIFHAFMLLFCCVQLILGFFYFMVNMLMVSRLILQFPICLGWAGATTVEGQSYPRSIWQRKNCQKWQLLTFRKYLKFFFFHFFRFSPGPPRYFRTIEITNYSCLIFSYYWIFMPKTSISWKLIWIYLKSQTCGMVPCACI